MTSLLRRRRTQLACAVCITLAIWGARAGDASAKATPTAPAEPSKASVPKADEADDKATPATKAPASEEERDPIAPEVQAKAEADAADAKLEAQVLHTKAKAEGLAALMSGASAPSLDPDALFDFRIDDAEERAAAHKEVEAAEAAAIRRMVQEAEAGRTARSKSQPEAGTKGTPVPGAEAQEAEGAAVAEAGPSKQQDGPAAPSPPTLAVPETSIPNVDPNTLTGPEALSYWQAKLRVALLAFLAQPDEVRQTQLADQRQVHAATVRETAALAEAEARAQSAEAERMAALEAARVARTEAERLVAEETARLLTIKRKHAEEDAELTRLHESTQRREEAVLRLERQVRGTIDGNGTAVAISSIHVDVERAFTEALSQFSRVLRKRPLPISSAGDDPMASLTIEVDATAVQKLRLAVENEERRLSQRANEVLSMRRLQLYLEVRNLSKTRLEILGHLPPEEQSKEMKLSGSGLGNAAREIRQVGLILRYHFLTSLAWFDGVRSGQVRGGPSALTTGATAFQVVFWFVVFIWVRRRVPGLLALLRERVNEDARLTSFEDQEKRLRILTLLERVNGQLLWLGLLWGVHWLLPSAARQQLEVSMLFTIFAWTLTASLLVQAIDALASTGPVRTRGAEASQTRIRSLVLVGRVVVSAGLILSLSQQLVGRGTIYYWVSNATIILGVPVALLLASWWRPIVLERLELLRRKKAVDRWVLAHPTGLVGLLGSGFGGLRLLVLGILRAVRTRADELVFTRRILAYLFQRELDRKAAAEPKEALLPLDQKTFDALSPEAPSSDMVETILKSDLEPVLVSLESRRGGIYSIVGERGAGKSSALSMLEAKRKVIRITATESLEGVRVQLCQAAGLPGETPLDEVAAHLDSSDTVEAVLIDRANLLIEPVIGGIAPFDGLIAALRENATSVSWVLTFERVIWNFYEGARGARPTFDETVYLSPWNEAEIRALLEDRTRRLGLSPKFDLLLPDLPPDADGFDRADALDNAMKSYYRLLWDYAGGNPAVALHMWRRCLARSGDDSVFVQIFQAPRTAELEDLPDPAVFVLRAVVQLGIASQAEVEKLTKLSPRIVTDSLRYSLRRGYIQAEEDGYRVTWGWFRTITVYLERRHLLAARSMKRSA